MGALAPGEAEVCAPRWRRQQQLEDFGGSVDEVMALCGILMHFAV
jgi:hypothetical protein